MNNPKVEKRIEEREINTDALLNYINTLRYRHYKRMPPINCIYEGGKPIEDSSFFTVD